MKAKIITPVITILNEREKPDYPGNGTVIDFLIRGGVDGILVLGPFQGKPACVKIPMGKGVCGTAAARDVMQLVDNVHEFPGHIACDGASNSEIVIPLHVKGELWGVLDIDSPLYSRFSPEDAAGLVRFAQTLEEILETCSR